MFNKKWIALEIKALKVNLTQVSPAFFEDTAY